MKSERKDAVLATIIMRLTIDQSLEYLRDKGYPISRATYCRIKSKLEHDKLKRLYSIAKNFESFHLERISELQEIRRLLWKHHNDCKDPLKKAIILEKIKEIQPYLSAFMEATKDIIEHKKVEEVKKKRKRLQELEQEDNNDQST